MNKEKREALSGWSVIVGAHLAAAAFGLTGNLWWSVVVVAVMIVFVVAVDPS